MNASVSGHEGLPGAWTDLGQGVTREQVDTILQFDRVAIYLDGEPVAVLVSVEDYLALKAAQDFIS